MNQTKLKQMLSYDPHTGLFTWTDNPWRPDLNGKRAGCYLKNRYGRISIEGKKYLAHRLAWFYVHGKFPDGMIDHINGVKDDNRLCNLRVARNQAEQQQNQKLRLTNTSGYMGVYRHKKNKNWVARIRCGGSHIALGCFETAHEAGQAYIEAKAKLHTFNPEVRDYK